MRKTYFLTVTAFAVLSVIVFWPHPDQDTVGPPELKFNCMADDYDCTAKFFSEITKTLGPGAAVDELAAYISEGKISPAVDDHQRVH